MMAAGLMLMAFALALGYRASIGSTRENWSGYLIVYSLGLCFASLVLAMWKHMP